jgi:hypothetical protein
MSMQLPTECSHCGSADLYTCRFPANGGHGPTLLPGLGRLFSLAKLDAVLCASCGHYQLFADAEMRERVREQQNWKKVRRS